MDNIVQATTSMRSSVSKLKKRLSDLRIQVETFDAEIEKIETKFDNILTQAEIYKSKLEREMGREVRRLNKELEQAKKAAPVPSPEELISTQELNIASTIAIFNSLLFSMCGDEDDFRLACEAFLFPVVFQRLMDGEDDAYYLTKVPASAPIVVERGREYIKWIRENFSTHLTYPETWEEAMPQIRDWLANDALPLLYGARDDQWDIDIPFSLTEILLWHNSPIDRPLNFSSIFDAYEIYRKHKDTVFHTTGLLTFEQQQFLRK